MIRNIVNFILFKLKNPSCKVHYSVRVSRKAIVGVNCEIGRGSSISPTVVLGDNVVIGEGG